MGQFRSAESLVLSFLAFCALTCKEVPPEPLAQTTIQLAVVDTSCTEAWLKVSLTDASEPRKVALNRDGQTVLTARLTTNDSVLVDEGLFPHHTYTYQALRLRDNGVTFSTSNAGRLTTLDTTSHNFTFQIDTLGDGNASVLYDVAIINDNLAYAVGALYLAGDPRRYNLAVWNGVSWQVERLMYQGSPPIIRSIYVFSPNDVWLDPWFHWNGQSFQEVPIDPIFVGGGVNKMWGNTSGELYVVGNTGFIARRSSFGIWEVFGSGTTVDIQDIYGSTDPTSGRPLILAVASFINYGRGLDLLSIRGTSVSKLDTSGLRIAQSSVWSVRGKGLYVVGDGIFTKRRIEDDRWKLYDTHPLYYARHVRGNSVNDLFVVGDFGLISHFNGVTWKHYTSVEIPSFDGSFISVAQNQNTVVAVGLINDAAIVLRGRR